MGQVPSLNRARTLRINSIHHKVDLVYKEQELYHVSRHGIIYVITTYWGGFGKTRFPNLPEAIFCFLKNFFNRHSLTIGRLESDLFFASISSTAD
jgi:hypothetical protein